MKRVIIKIYGNVQGVFFRVNTKRKADELELRGYVKNEPDGTILIVAEGKKENLQKLIEWCYRGPEDARIEKINIDWQEPTGEFSEFVIRYN